jgi:S-adenosylmethionine:tRNA ribosyltransferase-isomerase
MHAECISAGRSTIERLRNCREKIIAVGTTSVRTLESLYYTGVLLEQNPGATGGELVTGQWMPYRPENNRLSVDKALENILRHLDRTQSDRLLTHTRILIAPGYPYKLVQGMITNFHQPRSTLLLLVSAFVGEDWKRIYDYALAHGFRFLSYGDSCLLL